jgi:hypothetical protein
MRFVERTSGICDDFPRQKHEDNPLARLRFAFRERFIAGVNSVAGAPDVTQGRRTRAHACHGFFESFVTCALAQRLR